MSSIYCLLNALILCLLPIFITLSELSVADSFFIAKRYSIVALAIIMNSLDEFSRSIDLTIRGQYIREVTRVLGISHDDNTVDSARRRLRLLSAVNGNGD